MGKNDHHNGWVRKSVTEQNATKERTKETTESDLVCVV